MNLKRVVGVVLVILGALALLGAGMQYHGLVVEKTTSTVKEAFLSGSLGNLIGGTANAHTKGLISPKAKMLAILIILIGGLLTIIGALMLNKRASNPIDAYEIDLETDAGQGSRFKL